MDAGADVRRRQVHPRLRLLVALAAALALAYVASAEPARAFAVPDPLPVELEVATLSAKRKAALVVVAGLPAPRGVGGAIVFSATRDIAPPRGAAIFVDQEGGVVKRYPGLPPHSAALSYRSSTAARMAGRATGAALRRIGVHVDLAPVLDSPDGPLGTRHFRRAGLAIAFAKGLTRGGTAPCVKHFPGLGSTPESTDVATVFGSVRVRELRGFRSAIDAGVPCVMVGHAIYPELGRRRASLQASTYALLRRQGFEGVAITDSLTALGPGAVRWARLAMRAGADLVLVQEPGDVRPVIKALTPLARKGKLDAAVTRVIRFRRAIGFEQTP